MLLERYMQNFKKLAQLEIPKNRRELYNDVIISKFTNPENRENTGNIFGEKKIRTLVNVTRRAHVKFQDVSSMENTYKFKGTMQ